MALDSDWGFRISEGWRRLRASPVDVHAWLALAQAYAEQSLPWQLDHCWTQASRSMALANWQDSPPSKPVCQGPLDPYWQGGATQLTLSVPWSGLLPALEALQAVMTRAPGDWLTAVYTVRCLDLRAQGEPAEVLGPVQAQAKALVRLALGTEPIKGETGHLLAQWRLRAGAPEQALSAATAALAHAPERHGTWLLQAQALMQLGRIEDAKQAFAKAGESRNPNVLALVADKLFIFNFGHEALAVREAVAGLQPLDARAWLALGELQAKLWQVDKAKTSVRRALELAPDNPVALRYLDDLEAAGHSKEQFRRECQRFQTDGLGPNAQGGTRLLMQSLYQAHLNATEVADLHKQVGAAMEAQALQQRPADTPCPAEFAGLRDGRRLRVGYVSGDLHRQHPVNIFMLPILQRHDAERFEVFVYHTGTFIDEYTRAARQATQHWRECAQLDDVALHSLIVQDELDVLVDLAGHTATHRLGVFALRAAPVQASYLGYPHSTGLKCIDWMVVDEVVAPPEHQHLFTEKLAYVSGSVFCWAPDEDYPIGNARRSGANDVVTLGSFNNLLKLDDETAAVWARILSECPQTRLVLKSAVLADPVVVDKTLERFAALGVQEDRLDLRGPSELSAMMQEYLDVDVALDPFPYNGGTTSLQALWMGCPLVTLEGNNFVSRMGSSFLRSLGRTDWVAVSEDAYIAIAKRIIAEGPLSQRRRKAQRQAMQQSPLCNINRHTLELEQALYKMAVPSSNV